MSARRRSVTETSTPRPATAQHLVVISPDEEVVEPVAFDPRGGDTIEVFADQRSEGTNAAVMSVAEFMGKVATLGYTLIAARVLTQNDFGAFAFALAFAGLLQAVPSWGFDQVLLQQASRTPERAGAFLGNTIVLRFGIAIPLFVIAGGLSCLSRPSATSAAALILVLLAAGGDLYGDAIRSVAAARHNQVGVAVALVVQRVMTCVLAAALLIFDAGLFGVAFGYFVGSMIGVVATWIALRRIKVRTELRAVNRHTLSEVWKLSWALGINVVAGYILFRFDAVMLGWIAGDRAVASYSVAYRIFETSLVFSWTVGRSILPTISADPVRAVIRRGLSSAIGTITFIYAPIAAFMIVDGPALVGLVFGHRYVNESSAAVRWLALGPLVFALAQNVGYALVALGRTRALLFAGLAATGVNVIANLFVIPRYGGAGAAAATVGAYIVELSIVRTLLAREGWAPKLLPLVAAPVLAAGALGAVAFALHTNVVVEGLAGGVVYLAVWAVLASYGPVDALALLAPVQSRILSVPGLHQLRRRPRRERRVFPDRRHRRGAPSDDPARTTQNPSTTDRKNP
jgi:O-antigen/teichoic acid export membrane protein